MYIFFIILIYHVFGLLVFSKAHLQMQITSWWVKCAACFRRLHVSIWQQGFCMAFLLGATLGRVHSGKVFTYKHHKGASLFKEQRTWYTYLVGLKVPQRWESDLVFSILLWRRCAEREKCNNRKSAKCHSRWPALLKNGDLEVLRRVTKVAQAAWSSWTENETVQLSLNSKVCHPESFQRQIKRLNTVTCTLWRPVLDIKLGYYLLSLW